MTLIHSKLSIFHFFYALGCFISAVSLVLSRAVVTDEEIPGAKFWHWGLRVDAIVMGVIALPFLLLKVLPNKVDFDLIDQYSPEAKMKVEAQSNQRATPSDDTTAHHSNDDNDEDMESCHFLRQVLNLAIELKDTRKEEEDEEKKRKLQRTLTNSSACHQAHRRYCKRSKVLDTLYFLAITVIMLLYRGMEISIPGWLYNYSVFGISMSVPDSFNIFLTFWAGFLGGRLFDFAAAHFVTFRPHFILLVSSFSAIILFSFLIIVHIFPDALYIVIIFGVGLSMSFLQHSVMKINIFRFAI